MGVIIARAKDVIIIFATLFNLNSSPEISEKSEYKSAPSTSSGHLIFVADRLICFPEECFCFDILKRKYVNFEHFHYEDIGRYLMNGKDEQSRD